MKRFSSLVVTVGMVAAGCTFLLAGASSAALSSSLPSLTLALNGSSVTVGGAMQSGAVNVVSTVTKVAQGEPTLVHLNNNVTFQQAFGAVQKAHGDINALNPYGAIVFNASVNKGTSTAQTVLVPGNYVALDTQKSSGVPPHAEFTVTAATNPAALPRAAATMSAIEFGFRGPSTLRNGTLVRFANDGYLVHMIVWVRAKNASAAKQITALLLAGKDRKIGPKVATGFGTFAGPLSSGGLQQEVMSAKPGVYVLACFMDTQDRREHTRLGMVRTIHIK